MNNPQWRWEKDPISAHKGEELGQGGHLRLQEQAQDRAWALRALPMAPGQSQPLWGVWEGLNYCAQGDPQTWPSQDTFL